MRSTAALLLLGLVVCAATAQAQKKDDKPLTDVATALNNNGHKLAAAVLEIAGAGKAAQHPKARYTLLLPTDAAIQTFLKDMGLTVDDLKKRPVLAKQLVAQHTLLRHNVREAEIFAKGDSRKAATLASISGKPDLEFKRSGGKITITDPQGNVANVVGKPFSPDSEKTVIPIDRVLMGDDYYTSFDAVCKHRKDRVSSFCDAVKSTGLDKSLTSSLDATVFAPNNAGFAKATAGGAPSKAALTDILKYHVVPGARELPKQWKDGASFPTLLTGKDLKLNYNRVSAKGTKRRYDWAEARVVPADGQGVAVLKSNVHVGKAVVHGIGAVLNPNAAPAKPAATSTEKAPATKTGRRLLNFGWGMEGGPTAEIDDASSAITNAVYGNESAAAAADSSRLGAAELSVPGDYNQVVNGINPW